MILNLAFNKIADYGFINELKTDVFGFDHRENFLKEKLYCNRKYPTLESYNVRLKNLLSDGDAIFNEIKVDKFMVEKCCEAGYDVDKIVKSSDLYITEPNPIHLMHSLARYGLAPYKWEDIVDIPDIWMKWIYFYTYNFYRNMGLEGWKPDHKLHQFNGTSSPGYLYNRYFKTNSDLSVISMGIVDLFEETVKLGIIPASVNCHFEKQCVQEKSKIGEIRTISHSPIHHSLVGKKYVHVIENAFIVNQDKSALLMGHNIFNGGMDDFISSCRIDSKYCHRQEDYSKQDNHENPYLMDVIFQARCDISGMSDFEKKVLTCIEEHNRNPFRVTPFGEVYLATYCKASGACATCLNNCDKHMAINSLEHAIVACEEDGIEFNETNFSRILRRINERYYMAEKTFSDDSLKSVLNDVTPYFMSNDYNLSLQDMILGKFGLLIKKKKLSEFKNNYFTSLDFNYIGPKWLGNYLVNVENRVCPCRPVEKLIFGMCTFNPESKVADYIIDNPNDLLGWAYRLSKLFSYMVHCLNDKKLFGFLKNVRDIIIKDVKDKYEDFKPILDKLMNNQEFDNFTSMFVELRQLGIEDKRPEIWEYEDFYGFVTSMSYKKTVDEFMCNVLYEVERLGIDLSEGNNPVLELLSQLGYNIRNKPGSKFMAAEHPWNILGDKIYPFIGISGVDVSDIVKRNYYSFQTDKIDGPISNLYLDRAFDKLGIKFYNKDINKFSKFSTNFVPICKYTEWNKLLLENEDRSKRIFLVEPIIGYLIYQRKRFIFNSGYTITYSSIGKVRSCDYAVWFDYYSIVNSVDIDQNFKLLELKLREKPVVNDNFRLFNNLSTKNTSVDEFLEFGMPYFGIGDKQDMLKNAVRILEGYYKFCDEKLVHYLAGSNYLDSDLDLQDFENDEISLNNKFLQFINGGPGCGKTEMIAKCVKFLLPKFVKFAIVSSTNEQVINICRRFEKYEIGFKLVCSSTSIMDNIDMLELSRRHSKPSKVVIGTTSMMYRSNSFRRCDCVIVDEITKCTIGEVLLMLSSEHMRNSCNKLILFGDKYQATIYNPNEIKNWYMNPFVESVKSQDCMYLSKTKRFGKNTCAALNILGYREEPITPSFEIDDSLECVYSCSNSCKSHEQIASFEDESTSFCNLVNIEIILNTKLKDYQVIVPYRAQRKLYLEHGIKAITIDSSQGKEFDKVILDITRCNKEANIGFLKNVNRVIVALSRHRTKLLVLGCENIILNSFFKVLIDQSVITLTSSSIPTFGKSIKNVVLKYHSNSVKFNNNVECDAEIYFVDKNCDSHDKNTIDSVANYEIKFDQCSLDIGDFVSKRVDQFDHCVKSPKSVNFKIKNESLRKSNCIVHFVHDFEIARNMNKPCKYGGFAREVMNDNSTGIDSFCNELFETKMLFRDSYERGELLYHITYGKNFKVVYNIITNKTRCWDDFLNFLDDCPVTTFDTIFLGTGLYGYSKESVVDRFLKYEKSLYPVHDLVVNIYTQDFPEGLRNRLGTGRRKNIFYLCAHTHKQDNYSLTLLKQAFGLFLQNISFDCYKNIKSIRIPNPTKQFWIEGTDFYQAIYDVFSKQDGFVIYVDDELMSQ